jgi:hypothetical protein
MSNLVCKNCKSTVVEYEDYCGGTSYYRCKTCGQWGDKDKFTQQTVFHRITQSPEVLAEKLTYWQYDPEQSRCGWTNNIIVGELYKNYHEAITATVARLKEVEK